MYSDVFSNEEAWRGKVNAADERHWLCNGLIRDWASWQRENGRAFAQLKQVLRKAWEIVSLQQGGSQSEPIFSLRLP